ncbi:glutaminyl-peptide cyclotransferase [Nocardia cyriacigeorgica]|uniref:glutaminyl-peptide cyclotransferase n=1 Tax=Nocardia cyriacigeorgica TaxID=135487 RepID=UPI0018956F07|nr:glutaminyl-peptide cyclotransferase [Nocardia cyriacigeorgica]MBF6087275.1 glutaminyl-peptide cyclotransferase [Nocardia cyriacigeorgica]MBF6092795.1 glutaminyl-peptide cyclotransferase [Nocardia cyriacigeorgica]MBF6099710.1 glutaminyl-peptide cyclotransferase [Nocardia cyriacigeorgica]MBF6397369.1 glutaminyl-peptide cyclotransferase [Nocardia cyriacigeorgica]MBF6402973.1 glutaminyl-peptide cyclotransferase [Nocardia cyriacigeorgica]
METDRRSLAVAALLCLLTATGCARADDPADQAPHLVVEVLGTAPHDPRAFTQGLQITDGVLYESTGMPGESGVRAVDRATGAELAAAELPAPLFGEGIAVAGDTLWQLTWKDGIAFARDPATLAERRQVSYEGEGWGLCARAGRLVMSDGSATLAFRDPVTFARTGSVDLNGRPSARLNELECAADGSVYANNWPTDEILRIDPGTGEILATIDASGLLPPGERAGADVLNGITQIPGTDRFLLTGKYWPTMFEVRFVPAS